MPARLLAADLLLSGGPVVPAELRPPPGTTGRFDLHRGATHRTILTWFGPSAIQSIVGPLAKPYVRGTAPATAWKRATLPMVGAICLAAPGRDGCAWQPDYF